MLLEILLFLAAASFDPGYDRGVAFQFAYDYVRIADHLPIEDVTFSFHDHRSPVTPNSCATFNPEERHIAHWTHEDGICAGYWWKVPYHEYGVHAADWDDDGRMNGSPCGFDGWDAEAELCADQRTPAVRYLVQGKN